MINALNLLIQGVSLGSLYAMVALGFVIVFKATRTVNFALPSMLLLGTYVLATLEPRIGFLLATIVGVGVAAAVGLFVERVLLARIDGHHHQAMSILTIGVNVVLIALITQLMGERIFSIGSPWDDSVLKFAGTTIPTSNIVTIAGAVTMIAVLGLLLQRTGWGLAMRASIEDREAAALMGIRLHRVSAGAWMLAGLLATVAGIGLASFPNPGLSLSTELAAIKAFPAAIIGGMDSLGGAIVGGLAIGMAEVLVADNQNHLHFLGQGINDVVAFVVMIGVLMWRPSGLFGSKELARV